MASPRVSGVRRLNAMLLQSREPAFVLDPQGRFAFVNPAWEGLAGVSAESVIGRPGLPSGEDADRLAFSPPPEALAGVAASALCVVARPDGARLSRRVEFWPFHDAEGALIGLLGLVRDADRASLAPPAESRSAHDRWAAAREAILARRGPATLIGEGPRHDRLLEQVAAASRARAPALIVGEPGSGRRTVARAIHDLGPSPSSPFLPLQVAALPAEGLAREIFAAGSAGLAGEPGSTWLVGDAADLPRDIQERLAASARDGPVRLLASTAHDPESAVRDGTWRPDFYYALTALVLRLAPLRERLDELPLLAQHFLERRNGEGPRRRTHFEPEAIDALLAYDWPGNLSELSRVVEAAHLRSASDPIRLGDLPASIRGDLASAYLPPAAAPSVTPLDDWLTRLERRLIEQALGRARHNKSRAAELLEISRPRLYRRIKELNIPDEGDNGEDASPA